MNFEIMKLTDIQEALIQKQLSIPSEIRSEFSDLVLKDSTLLLPDILEVEKEMSLLLPDSFKEAILEYDFGNLRLGNVWFGKESKYSSFLTKNNEPESSFPWWGAGRRPHNFLMVAGTDGYILLLNVVSEKVLAFERSDSWENCTVVSSNFTMFVRGAGSIYLQKRETSNLSDCIKILENSMKSQKSSTFWQELVCGVT